MTRSVFVQIIEKQVGTINLAIIVEIHVYGYFFARVRVPGVHVKRSSHFSAFYREGGFAAFRVEVGVAAEFGYCRIFACVRSPYVGNIISVGVVIVYGKVVRETIVFEVFYRFSGKAAVNGSVNLNRVAAEHYVNFGFTNNKFYTLLRRNVVGVGDGKLYLIRFGKRRSFCRVVMNSVADID